MFGIVRWYSAKGFGFIDPLPFVEGTEALYFHIVDVRGRQILKQGDQVNFDKIQAPKGPKCINVVKAEVAVEMKETQPCLKTQV